MVIGKTLHTSYTMETSTSPRSQVELSEVNFENDLGSYMASYMDYLFIETFFTLCKLLQVQKEYKKLMLKRTFPMISKELL